MSTSARLAPGRATIHPSSLAAKIAEGRITRGLSQRDFAAMIGRSESWVSQVERGVRVIDRMSVLRTVADALRTPISELLSGTPLDDSHRFGYEYVIDPLRRVFARSSLGTAVDTSRIALAELSDRVAVAVQLMRDARYHELIPMAGELISQLESQRARLTSPALHVLLAKIYYATSTASSKLCDTEAAWLASERGLTAAQLVRDPYLTGVGAVTQAQVFLDADRNDEAEATVREALALLDDDSAECPRHLTLVIVLRMQSAVIDARRRKPERVRRAMQRADELDTRRREYAGSLDIVSAQHLTPWRIAVAVESGDHAEACRLARRVNRADLSRSQATSMQLDLTRALLHRGDRSGALAALLEAEWYAAEYIRRHWWTRSVLQQLLRDFPEYACLREFARRCGILSAEPYEKNQRRGHVGACSPEYVTYPSTAQRR